MPNSTVRDCMLSNPPRVAPHQSVRAAAEQMCALDTPFVVVQEPGAEAIGLVTDRDITTSLATGRDPQTTRVRDVVSARLVFCRDSDDLEDAAWLMERHATRRLVVLDGERRVVGVISVDDIAHGMTARLAGDVLRHTRHAG